LDQPFYAVLYYHLETDFKIKKLTSYM